MKIEIDSLGEGHTHDQIGALMAEIQAVCLRSGFPHALLVGTLNYNNVAMPESDARELWIMETVDGNTNMAFEPWKVEYFREKSLREAVYRSLRDFRSRTGPDPEKLKERLETLRVKVDEAENKEYDFTMYAQTYNDWLRDSIDGVFPPYSMWVREQLASPQ